jgi:hypothetical protein
VDEGVVEGPLIASHEVGDDEGSAPTHA